MNERPKLNASEDLVLLSSTQPMFEAPAGARPLASEILRTADCDGPYRWTLGRRWREGPHVLFIGHNPSTADQDGDDPTSVAWMKFAAAWGFGGYVAANLYPLRTSDPTVCRTWANRARDPFDRSGTLVVPILERNEKVVLREARRAELVVACFGAVELDPSTGHLLDELYYAGIDLHCLGFTLFGMPKHPMARGRHRIPADTRPQIWRQGAGS